MAGARQFFHYVSYLQYPLMLLAMFFSVKPIIFGFDTIWADYNKLLVFMGLGISFSTFQDTQKTQNKLSKRVWENSRWGKIALLVMSLTTFWVLAFGMFGYFASENDIIRELAFGVIVLGIGLIGMLKAAIEMFENHRKDKQRSPTNE